MANSRIESQKPYVLAMVICDFVWQDLSNGKCSLLGTYSVIASKQFPITAKAMGIYIAITDGRGKVPIRIQIVDADEAKAPTVQINLDVEFADPTSIREIVVNMKNVKFPRPGEYRVQVFAANDFLLERRLGVARLGEKG